MAAAAEDRGPVVLAVAAAMVSCSTVFVSFRLGSRAGIVKKIMLDDYFIILAWIVAFGMAFSICDATRNGLGKHEEDVPDSQRAALNRLNYTFTALYNPALMATKTSILVFFLTLAKQQRAFTWTIWATLFVVNAAGLALSLVNLFQCRPMSVVFDQIRPPGSHCTDIVTLYLSSAPVNIITDIVILLLPMPVLKGMRLPRKQKWILYITFGFGIFVAAVDVVRISYLQTAAVTRAEDVLNGQGSSNAMQTERNSDFSWYAAYSFMWSVVEVNVGIMVACVPALKPLVSRFVPQLIKDRVASVSNQHHSNATLNTVDMAAVQRVPSVDLPPAEHMDHHEPPTEARMHTLSFQESLTMPETVNNPTPIPVTDVSAASLRGTATNYDFVSMTESKAIVYMSSRESVRPIAEVTLLFFLWGFAYGLLGALNTQIQTVARETAGQAVGTHSAYYVGYFFAPLTFGRLILKKRGFKACYMIGLMIYGTGTLIFWPAAVLTSWPVFLISNFLIGLGLSTLELAANPFIALCGPPEYGEMRLNLSQGFQACGTVFANTLAKKALFQKVLDAPSLIDVQWTYLAISLFTFVLAFVYYVVKVPEVTDDELEDSAEQTYSATLNSLRKDNTIWVTLGFAVFAQFCYVGAQENLATSLDAYIAVVSPKADPVNYEVVGETLFAVSRFLSAFLGICVRPRTQLAFFFAGAILFSALAMNFSGLTAGAMIMCVFFFEGPLFALIYAMPLRALGKYTKDSSALLAAAISGGSFFPAIMHVVAADGYSDRGVQYSLCVAVAAFAFGASFPIYVNLVPQARTQVDLQPRLNESFKRPKATLAAIQECMEDDAHEARSSPCETGDRSSKTSRQTEGATPLSATPENARAIASFDGKGFDQSSLGLQQHNRDSLRSLLESTGTPIITDFGAVDYGKYGRPPS